jgi:hypothetical protein
MASSSIKKKHLTRVYGTMSRSLLLLLIDDDHDHKARGSLTR